MYNCICIFIQYTITSKYVYLQLKYLNVRIKEYAMRYAGIHNMLHTIALTSGHVIFKKTAGPSNIQGLPWQLFSVG